MTVKKCGPSIILWQYFWEYWCYICVNTQISNFEKTLPLHEWPYQNAHVSIPNTTSVFYSWLIIVLHKRIKSTVPKYYFDKMKSSLKEPVLERGCLELIDRVEHSSETLDLIQISICVFIPEQNLHRYGACLSIFKNPTISQIRRHFKALLIKK